MKKIDHRDRSEILWWDTDYNGAAIYALIDEDGKMYIGQTAHLQNRLRTHRRNFNRLRQGHQLYGYEEGQRLIDAISEGRTFHAVILKELALEESTNDDLRYWECRLYALYGKRNKPNELAYNLYNSTFPNEPSWNYRPKGVPIKTVT